MIVMLLLGSAKKIIAEVDRHIKEEFSAFKHTEDELDTFLFTYLGKKQRYEELWPVVNLLLTLSHGQAQVERAFSTNKDIVSTNMAAETLIAFHGVYDGIQDQSVTSEMLMESLLTTGTTFIWKKHRSATTGYLWS